LAGDLTASRKVLENQILAEWEDVRDIQLLVSGLQKRSPRYLNTIFAPYGTILDIYAKDKGRGRAVAYVTLRGSARRAFRACKGLSVEALFKSGYPSRVTFSARNKRDITAINGLVIAHVERRRGGGALSQQQAATASYLLHVGWLTEVPSRYQILDFFRPYGQASIVRTMRSRVGTGGGPPRTFVFVNLKTTSREAAVNACVELTGSMLSRDLVEVTGVRTVKGKESSKRTELCDEVKLKGEKIL
jgi:hypothetical protein